MGILVLAEHSNPSRPRRNLTKNEPGAATDIARLTVPPVRPTRELGTVADREGRSLAHKPSSALPMADQYAFYSTAKGRVRINSAYTWLLLAIPSQRWPTQGQALRLQSGGGDHRGCEDRSDWWCCNQFLAELRADLAELESRLTWCLIIVGLALNAAAIAAVGWMLS